jgi:hypothetical protein
MQLRDEERSDAKEGFAGQRRGMQQSRRIGHSCTVLFCYPGFTAVARR